MALTALSGLFSFLGGSFFRMIWGEVSSYFNKLQDHQFEIERMNLQNTLDDANHTRTIEMLRLQSELGLKVVEAQSAANIGLEEAKAFTVAQANAFQRTGIFLVDLWNNVIRPACATVALVLWIYKLVHVQGVMDAWDLDLIGAIFGFFFADRSLIKRGK